METTNRNNTKNTEVRKALENFNLYQILTAQLFNNNKKRGNTAMKTAKILIQSLLIALMITSAAKTFSQDISGTLSSMAEDSSKKYSQILTNALSSNINSGMYNVTKPGNKFSIYFGVKASATFLSSDEKLPGTTVNVPVIPFAIMQLNAGSIAGTDVFVRYLPKVTLGSYASVSAWGVGIQHSLGKDFKMPIDVTFAFSTHSLTLNDSKGKELMGMTSFSASTMVSKTFGIITLYTSFQYEKSTSTINYIITEPAAKHMNYSQENENSIRAITGFNLKMGPVNLTADYNFAKNSAVSMGLGFGF
jgi:hypothetical protein